MKAHPAHATGMSRRKMTTRAYAGRLIAVAGTAPAADWATKAILRSAVHAVSHRGLVPGLQLVHLERIGVPSSFTLAAAVLIVGAAAVGWIRGPYGPERSPALWLPAGLLIGGAASNFQRCEVLARSDATG
jgi:hypothetical protein